MIEFAAGIMVGGSVGAVIMGALLSQARAMAADVRGATTMRGPASTQPLRHSARQTHDAEGLPMLLGAQHGFVAASSQIH